MTLKFLGTGDAFGSGGRFNTCFYVEYKHTKFLIDCGASSLIAMKRHKIDPGSIDYVFLSHLHGDHFGGIPFLVRETQVISKRKRPLIIVGPKESTTRINNAMEIFFPGSTKNQESSLLDIREYESENEFTVNGIKLLTFPTLHTSGTNSHALRINLDGKIIAYSGDTEWTDTLIEVAYNSDLFICECYTLLPKKNHMDYKTLSENKAKLRSKKIFLTHMSKEMLDAIPNLDFECAKEGGIFKFS